MLQTFSYVHITQQFTSVMYYYIYMMHVLYIFKSLDSLYLKMSLYLDMGLMKKKKYTFQEQHSCFCFELLAMFFREVGEDVSSFALFWHICAAGFS